MALRETPLGVYLVGTAAGPIGGDEVMLEIEITEGADLTIRSAAAMIALPGPPGARSRLTVRANVAGRLRWLPEPSIAARGCDHIVDVRLRIGEGGRVEWRDELVLGRDGEPPGAWTSFLSADHDEAPLLRQSIAIGANGWDGPAVAGDSRAIGSILLAGETYPGPVAGKGFAVLPLAGRGALVTAVAENALTLRARLDQARGPVVSRESAPRKLGRLRSERRPESSGTPAAR